MPGFTRAASKILRMLVSLWCRCGCNFFCAFREAAGPVQYACSPQLQPLLLQDEGFDFLREHLTGDPKTACEVLAQSLDKQQLVPSSGRRHKAANRTLRLVQQSFDKLGQGSNEGSIIAFAADEGACRHYWCTSKLISLLQSLLGSHAEQPACH